MLLTLLQTRVSRSMRISLMPVSSVQLECTTQDSCSFYGRQAVLDSFGGVVLSKSEGARIAEKLGNGTLIILQNHGLLYVHSQPDLC